MEEQQQSSATSAPIYQQSQEKNAKWLWLLVVLIIVGAIIFAFVKGIGPLARFKGEEEFAVEESPTTTSEVISSPSPEATEGAELDRSQPKVRILNGSGKAGAASSVKDFLEGKGYQVVAVGNADNYDFEQTVIKLKEEFVKFQETLFKDMSSEYSVSVDEERLSATESADIEVTVGSK